MYNIKSNNIDANNAVHKTYGINCFPKYSAIGFSNFFLISCLSLSIELLIYSIISLIKFSIFTMKKKKSVLQT